MIFLASAAYCAAVWCEVFLLRGGIVRLPLPIAGHDGFPVPLLSWAALALYTAATRKDDTEPAAHWPRAVAAGFAVHLIALLASLIGEMARNIQVELSVWYVRYWHALWAAGLAGALAWVHTARRRRRGREWLIAPVAMSAALWWAVSLLANPRTALGAALAGAALALLLRTPWCRRAVNTAGRIAHDEQWFLTAIVLAAVALRLFYMTRVMSNPDFLNTGSDGPAYDALARALLEGRVDPTWGHIPMFAPGYVRFLTLVYATLGSSYKTVCAVQSVIGALACVLLYLVAKRLCGVRVARLAAVFGAVNFHMIFAAAAVGHQALDVYWTLLLVWCLLEYLEQPQRLGRWMPALGLILGWAVLTREGNLAFWAFLIPWFLLAARVRVGWRRAALHVAVLSVFAWLVVRPFMGQGSLQGRMSAQWFFYQYAGVNINKWFNPWRDGAAAWALLADQPLRVLSVVGKGLLGNFNAMFMNQGFGSFDPVFLLRWSTYFYGLWAYAFLFAFIGLVLVVWRALRQPAASLGWWLILTVLVSRSLIHLFFEAAYRHRTPLEPYLILLAAYGATRLFSRDLSLTFPLNRLK